MFTLHSQKLLKALNNADDEYIVAYISALSECALYAPTQFEGKGEEILRFLLQDLIHREVESVRNPSFFTNS